MPRDDTSQQADQRLPRAMTQYVEALEVLAGTRTREKGRAAVRMNDMKGILQVPQTLVAVKVTTTPTDEQYNALLRDVTAISTALQIVAKAIHTRLESLDTMQRPHT